MARLIRPHIPLRIRCLVATRQCYMAGFNPPAREEGESLASLLRRQLEALFGGAKIELHHRPALVNRQQFKNGRGEIVRYIPDANDPHSLVYLLKDDHDIETRVRGVGAQRSDLSQARYLKKVARNRVPRAKPSGLPFLPSSAKPTTLFAVKVRPPKRKWLSRPFPKRSKR